MAIAYSDTFSVSKGCHCTKYGLYRVTSQLHLGYNLNGHPVEGKSAGQFSIEQIERSHEDPNDDNSPLCGGVPEDAMHLFRTIDDVNLPWTGIVGQGLNAIWYWCSDQV